VPAGQPASRRPGGALLALLVLLAGCSATAQTGEHTDGTGRAAERAPDTSVPPATVPPPSAPVVGPPPGPGALVDATPITAPPGTRAWRITYGSRGVGDRPTLVSGVLLAPDGPDGASDRPLVTYGHATTGTADDCAPSRQGTTLLPFPEAMAARGWAVVMSDYEGLGTDGPHPYLVGVSAGRNLLDAARAARSVPGAGVGAASRVGILGFSQGGHAAAFAAQQAAADAPDLAVVGVALAAPVSDVVSFTRRAEDIQPGVLVTVAGSYARAYPELDLAAVLTDTARADIDVLERRCIGEVNNHFNRPVAEVMKARATTEPGFRARMDENLTGQAPPGMPALVVQGQRDDIVDPAATHQLVQRWCARGAGVDEVLLPERNHAALAEQPFFDWLAARFAGEPAPSTC
jgi:acetyl esterase/lipase